MKDSVNEFNIKKLNLKITEIWDQRDVQLTRQITLGYPNNKTKIFLINLMETIFIFHQSNVLLKNQKLNGHFVIG